MFKKKCVHSSDRLLMKIQIIVQSCTYKNEIPFEGKTNKSAQHIVLQ